MRLLIVLLTLLVTSTAHAEQVFVWNWTQGIGGAVTKWLIRCGPNSTMYDTLLDIPDTAGLRRSMPVSVVLGQTSGTFFCIVSASNEYGVSLPSPEVQVTYQAGQVPNAPAITGVR